MKRPVIGFGAGKVKTAVLQALHDGLFTLAVVVKFAHQAYRNGNYKYDKQKRSKRNSKPVLFCHSQTVGR